MEKLGKFALAILGIVVGIEVLSTIYVPEYDIFDIFSEYRPIIEGGSAPPLHNYPFSERMHMVFDGLRNDFVEPIYNIVKSVFGLIGRIAEFIENLLG